jgi:hypothetical protein
MAIWALLMVLRVFEIIDGIGYNLLHAESLLLFMSTRVQVLQLMQLSFWRFSCIPRD